MSASRRPVDRAMGQERPEKSIVRSLWLREAREFAERFPDDEGPIYLTLGGAEGKDIQLLAENGLIRRTETNAVAEEDKAKIVAIEASPPAVFALQQQFPGLRILEVPFQNVIKGSGLFAWPGKEEERYCRARVINLDFNAPLHGEVVDGEVFFPVIAWVEKLARLHARPPRRDWSLCLTLHGEITWDRDTTEFTRRFLAENLDREPKFAESCRSLLGDDLFGRIASSAPVSFSEETRDLQQQLLRVVVPKLITQVVHQQGWVVKTEQNLRYGATGYAPMVTWVVRFAWDASIIATPDLAYRSALAEILKAPGRIGENGIIEVEA